MELEMAEKKDDAGTSAQETKRYIPLEERSQKDLRKFAEKLDLNLPVTMSREKMAQAIKVEQTKRQLQIEEEAKTKLKAEKLVAMGMKPGAIRKPVFEEYEIEHCKKVFVRFINREDPAKDDKPAGDLEFNKGEKYRFHLWETNKNGDTATFVMPECIVTKTDRSHKWFHISVANKSRPIYKDVKDPRTGIVTSQIVGRRPRFEFIILGDAPKDAPFGLYLEEAKE